MQNEPTGWDDEPVYATVPWESELRDSKRSSYTLDVFLDALASLAFKLRVSE